MSLIIRCGGAHVHRDNAEGRTGVVVDVSGEDLIALARNFSDSQASIVAANIPPASLASGVAWRPGGVLKAMSNNEQLAIARELPASVIRTVAAEVGKAFKD